MTESHFATAMTQMTASAGIKSTLKRSGGGDHARISHSEDLRFLVRTQEGSPTNNEEGRNCAIT
jgi:hypothetical protein